MDKVTEVCNRLDGIKCICGQDPTSEFHWVSRGRLAVFCRVCDYDLILKYGEGEETIPGYLDLNKWKGTEELTERLFTKSLLRPARSVVERD